MLQLVTYYDQKRALSRQQMMVCNQCPKMKIYQDATQEADINFEKYQAQYTLAEMQAKNADLGVTNATLNSQGAESAATRGVDSVTTLTQDLAAAEKTCDDKYPEEEEAKTNYNLAVAKISTFEDQRKKATKIEMNKLLKERRTKSYYLSMRGGSHVAMGTPTYDAVASTTKGAMTVSLWVKLTSLGHDSTLISTRGENGGEIYGWTLGANSEDGFYFDATTEGTQSGQVQRTRMKSGTTSMEITMNEWYNIAVTWGEEKKLYVNGYIVARGIGGDLIYESLKNMAGAGMKSHAGRSLVIGALSDSSKWLNGAVDNIAVWNRENTAEEIQGRCAKKDSTSNILQGTRAVTSFLDVSSSVHNESASAIDTSFDNTNPSQLLLFLNFGPKFDLGANIQSSVEGSGDFDGTVMNTASATWIPDDDGKVFCGALSNTMGRKVIRKLSEKTAIMRPMNDGACTKNTSVCENDECSPTNEGGVAIYLQPELFGNGAGQIPNPDQAGKRIGNVELLLSLGSGASGGDTKEEDVWIVKAFILTDNNACVKDSLTSANTTLEISEMDRKEGRVAVDLTAQLRELAQSGAGAMRGVYIVRADTSTPLIKGVSFLSTTVQDSQKRPQLIAGITDGDSPPIQLLKRKNACPQGTHVVCTSNEVQASIGFDGYDERSCGTMENKEGEEVTMRITSQKTQPVLGTCDKAEGIFCCSV